MTLVSRSDVKTLDLIVGLILAVLVLANLFSLRTAEEVGSRQATPTHTIIVEPLQEQQYE